MTDVRNLGRPILLPNLGACTLGDQAVRSSHRQRCRPHANKVVAVEPVTACRRRSAVKRPPRSRPAFTVKTRQARQIPPQSGVARRLWANVADRKGVVATTWR